MLQTKFVRGSNKFFFPHKDNNFLFKLFTSFSIIHNKVVGVLCQLKMLSTFARCHFESRTSLNNKALSIRVSYRSLQSKPYLKCSLVSNSCSSLLRSQFKAKFSGYFASSSVNSRRVDECETSGNEWKSVWYGWKWV